MKRLLDQFENPSRLTIGGKAFRLRALMDAGVTVKQAVVITADDVDKIVVTDRVPDEILESINVQLDLSSGFAVRSSATDEDGENSWAGQFVTELNVARKDLSSAIMHCIAQRSSERVQAYANTHGVQVPRLAIVVQEMVPAVTAGVLFTRDPRTVNQEMIVEAVQGFGEAFVSGEVNPRRYVLCRETGEVKRAEGCDQPELTRAQLHEIFETGNVLEILFDAPQDIEWAIDQQGVLFVTQSRDITTAPVDLEAVRERVIAETAQMFAQERQRLELLGVTYHQPNVISDSNIAELVTPHPTRMSLGMFCKIFAHDQGGIPVGRNKMGYEIGEELKMNSIVSVGGQPRSSLVHDIFDFRLAGMPLNVYARVIDHYLVRVHKEPHLTNYPEIVLFEQDPTDDWIYEVFGEEHAALFRACYNRFHERFRLFEDQFDDGYPEPWVTTWRAKMDAIAHDLVSKSVPPTRLFRRCVEALRTDACVHYVFVARVAFFGHYRLGKVLKELFADASEGYLNTLSAGGSSLDNPNLGFGLALKSLHDGNLTLEDVVATYGHLGVHEMELALPRYHEETGRIERLAAISQDRREEFSLASKRAGELWNTLFGETRIGLGASDIEEIRRHLDVLHRGLRWRETLKFEFLRAYDLIRQILLALERQLDWPKGTIFHLDPQELLAESLDWQDLRSQAIEHKSRWHEHRQLYIPTVLFEGDLESIGRPPALEGKQVLEGVAATNFIAEGRVVVVPTLEDEQALALLTPGCILVTTTTDPAWTPILSIIGAQGALITEIGGCLAHGAVYAREMGIAAVLNVRDATRLLKDGMRVRVNGPKSRVEILS